MGIRDWSRVDDRVWHGQYEDGVPREIEFEALTLPQILARSVQLYPERPAVTFLNRTLTYAQLSIEVERFAGALAALGVARGSKVAIQTPNLPQTVIAYFATLRLGAQTVMTNPMYMPREIEHQWCDAEVKVAVVMDFLYAGRVAPVRERLPVEHYIIASIPEYLRYPLKALAPLKLRRQRMMAKVAQDERTHGFTKLMSRAIPPPPDVDVRLDDVATLQYTGGTTGVSKGAMLTHHNLSYNLQQLAAWMPMLQRGGETLLGCLPYFHIYGQTVCLNMSVYLGAHQVLVPNPRDIDAMVKSVVKHKVTLMPAVPAMYNAVNQYPGIERYDLSSIKACNSGSAPLPDDSLRTFERLTGAKITEGFGLTETSPVTHSNPLFGKRKIGSIGVPLPDTDARIVDLEDGSTDRAIGEEGELLVRGPQVMKGYWRRPD
ncbi:MAG: AMP-binding protein, partial [Gemmatimonadales bacterium]